jgi:hypothetical protein
MKPFPLILAASIAIGAAGCAGTPEPGPSPTASARPAAAAPTSPVTVAPTASPTAKSTSGTTAGALSCSELAAAVARAEGTKRAASDKERDAWKAVVPFAVAARYASNRAAASEAERQLAGLHAEQARQGCDRHAS